MAHQYRQGRLAADGRDVARLRELANEVVTHVSASDGRARHHERGGVSVSIDRCGESAHRRHGAVGACEGSVAGRPIDAGAVRCRRGHPPCRRAVVANHAGVESRDSTSRRRRVRFAATSIATAAGVPTASAFSFRTRRSGRVSTRTMPRRNSCPNPCQRTQNPEPSNRTQHQNPAPEPPTG